MAYRLSWRGQQLLGTPRGTDAGPDQVRSSTDNHVMWLWRSTIRSSIAARSCSWRTSAPSNCRPKRSGASAILLKGGFLWVDDFWGTAAWNQWVTQISRVLPGEFQIFDIPISHPIMHTLYDVESFLQVPSIGSGPEPWPRIRARIRQRRGPLPGDSGCGGRLMVYITHNTDVADTWEREGENTEYFDLYSPRGYAIGVNAVVYALTH